MPWKPLMVALMVLPLASAHRPDEFCLKPAAVMSLALSARSALPVCMAFEALAVKAAFTASLSANFCRFGYSGNGYTVAILAPSYRTVLILLRSIVSHMARRTLGSLYGLAASLNHSAFGHQSR